MSTILQQSIFSFFNFPRYSRIGSTDSSTEGNTTKLHIWHIFSSKRAREVALILFVISLLAWTSTWLTSNRSLTKPFASGPTTAACPNVTTKESAKDSVKDSVDWSRFAYVQYATNPVYLCNSVMVFEILHRLNSKADRLLMYPSDFQLDGDPETESPDSRLLRKARDQYDVKLKAIKVQRRNSADATWAESFTKLLAFNQTQYDRVLHLDSDSTVLQTMDELFLLPPAPMAMPRAYWLGFDDRVLSSQIMLLQPSEFEFRRVFKQIETAASTDYDMEIVNTLYRDSALLLPHRPYNLLTGEFRNIEPNTHDKYLGNDEERWDPQAAYREAKFLHFSDWPYPKPWIEASATLLETSKPACVDNSTTNCVARDLWLGFYTDFTQRRKDVCENTGSLPQKQKRDLGGSLASIHRPVFL